MAAAAGLVVAGAGLWLWLGQHPALPFAERDWVLIAQFENRTGEPVFDATLEHALERELSNSRFVNVVPGERINDALLLMKRPPDSALTAAVAREVALRDGGIRALITGRIEKLDNTYLLSAALVDPASGATVRSFAEETAGEKQVVGAIRRLSGRVREALGEELSQIRLSEEQLEKVTTPLLHALQIFSRANALFRQGPPAQAAAEALLREAVAKDPDFASAHIFLAWVLRNEGRPLQAYREFAERALALAESASEAERYFIRGSYHELMGEVEPAISAYETLLQRFPDHYWASIKLANLYERLDRAEEAVPHFKRLAHLRPHDFLANCRAAFTLGRLTGNLDEVKLYLQRAPWPRLN
jgi:tetratricopeptide (TPR) repeat protein